MFALGIGLGTTNSRGELLEVYYPRPLLQPKGGAAIAKALGITATQPSCVVPADQVASLRVHDPFFAHFETSASPIIVCCLEGDREPMGVADSFLKLHLLSHRLVKPHQVNLNGIFSCLRNLAWTSEGAIDLAEVEARQFAARLRGETLKIHGVDKFPSMTDYVIPHGVRIADTARVRLGAYVGEGTTIMHEGFINFNAGCEGPNMIEGRISAGVMVGAHSDLGGGCSTMGTLSGGGNVVISVGANCLIGANAGTGIPLGNACTIEAGLYLTASSKVRCDDGKGQVDEVKAASLAGRDGLLFRRNSLTGAIECIPNPRAIKLNQELHRN